VLEIQGPFKLAIVDESQYSVPCSHRLGIRNRHSPRGIVVGLYGVWSTYLVSYPVSAVPGFHP
jgi:hypothetical protein